MKTLSFILISVLAMGTISFAQEKSTKTIQSETPIIKENQMGPRGPMMHQGEFHGRGQHGEFRGPPQRGPMFRGGPQGPQGPRFAQSPRGQKSERKCQCQCHEKRGQGKGKQFRGGR